MPSSLDCELINAVNGEKKYTLFEVKATYWHNECTSLLLSVKEIDE